MIGLKLIPPVENPLERLMARLPQVMAESMEKSLDNALSLARQRMRPGGGGPQTRTGRLARSLRRRVSRQGDAVLGELSADAPYAAAQEYGAVIQARQGKYLKFQVQGRWVSVRRVVLPARPFLRPAADQAVKDLQEYVFQALSEELS